MFNDPELDYKLYLGRIVGMTDRPPGKGKAVKWRKDIALDAIPSTLWCRADWFAPYIPPQNPEGYDVRTTPYYVWNPGFARDHNNREFEASAIVISPYVTFHESNNTYEISNKDPVTCLPRGEWSFCLDYVDAQRANKRDAISRGKSASRKRKADGPLDAEEAPVLAPAAPQYTRIPIEDIDIKTALQYGNPLQVMTIARSTKWVPASITKRFEDDECIVYHVKFDMGTTAACTLEELGKPPASEKRVRAPKKHFPMER